MAQYAFSKGDSYLNRNSGWKKVFMYANYNETFPQNYYNIKKTPSIADVKKRINSLKTD